jgi:myo-inositol 2-dehydrogenase / D-chiro-inositol 1-dehydrogenase
MSEPIRVGLLGLGQRGLQHLRVLWRLQGEGLLRVTGLADAWPDNLSEEKIGRFVDGFQVDGIRATTRFEELLADESIDALYVAIPPNRHAGQVVAAARAGIHLFVEKPMSLYLEEALEMERAIREAGVIATVGFQQRYDVRNVAVREFLAGKRVVMATEVSHGTLEGHSVKHTPTEKEGGPGNRVWAASFEWSGSTVVEAGIHQLDLMRFWCGDVAWVQSAYVPRDAEDIADGGDNPYAYSVTFGFASGAVGNLLMSRLRKVYHNDAYRSLLWSHGHIKFEREGPVAYYYDGPYPPERAPSGDQLRHPLPVPPSADPLEAISRAFLQAAATGDPSPLRSTFAGSMNSLAAVLAANVSHQRGGERIELAEFMDSPRYAEARARPGD